MYCSFYGFKKAPFSASSEPNFFYESASHREAYGAIEFGISQRKGIILITGEVGTGKTTLCKKVMGRLGANVKSSVIFNPYFSDVQLLRAIIEDFEIDCTKKNRLEMVNALNVFLIDLYAKGGNAVLIIDEAQHLSARQLEQVRLLSNLEASQEKLMQVVLMGQPELTENLSQYRLRQIRQRIFVKHNLLPLTEVEVKEYVKERFKDVGREDFKISEDCFKIINAFSGGIPRLINMLCDRALLMGYVREQAHLDGTILQDSIKEIA